MPPNPTSTSSLALILLLPLLLLLFLFLIQHKDGEIKKGGKCVISHTFLNPP